MGNKAFPVEHVQYLTCKMSKEVINVLYLWNRFDFVCLKLLAGAIETREKHYLFSMSHSKFELSHKIIFK